MIDYETIRVIWWLFIGAVAIGFAVTEGFDFGIGVLLPFLGRTDTERRAIISSIDPTWEGNQVGLILLGGAIFAVWPPVYATLFSGLYVVMLWVLMGMGRPEITAMAGPSAPSNPLGKTVKAAAGGWLWHFMNHPWMLLAPVLAFGGFAIAGWQAGQNSSGLAFLSSSIGIAGTLRTVGFGLFPFLLISSTDPGSSLTIWDASASHFNLLLSFWITVTFLPIVLLYIRWVYKVIWGRVTEAGVLQDSHTLY